MPFIVPEISTPSTPAAGYRKFYPKTDGWYDLDSAGNERGPFLSSSVIGGGYKITPTVVSNDLVLTLTHADGATPSASRPLFFRIGDTIRSVTAATSITLADATNWFNSGGTELAAKEIDYFAYVVWDSNSSIVALSFARIPWGRLVSDFSATTTNEKHLGNYANFTSTDDVVNIGRFAATLGVTATFLWTVPTFTTSNLIQMPSYETRWLTWLPAITFSGATTISSYVVSFAKYKISMQKIEYKCSVSGTLATATSVSVFLTLPFVAVLAGSFAGAIEWLDSGGVGFGGTATAAGPPDKMNNIKYNASAFATGAGFALVTGGNYEV